ncbi:hypothetical protein QTI66_39415, partial [Variovorax sp. J22R133]|uniref:hypothetical protein n=1 Tax=Variovorax brevis TaxID=3053503 RepID=UPI00257805B8
MTCIANPDSGCGIFYWIPVDFSTIGSTPLFGWRQHLDHAADPGAVQLCKEKVAICMRARSLASAPA